MHGPKNAQVAGAIDLDATGSGFARFSEMPKRKFERHANPDPVQTELSGAVSRGPGTQLACQVYATTVVWRDVDR